MPLFVTAIFLSAFLLFQVQPVIARFILPWYGGSPAVWTSCLLFFQVGLLGGYAYAHLLVSKLRGERKWQVGIHLGLLTLALFLLPITPAEGWKPTGEESNQIVGIIRLLAFTVGAPYLLLAASGPLLQHWFSEAFPGRSPWRLYAISNAGSLLGLLTYPFFFEPLLTVSRQTVFWSVGFLAYAIVAAVAAMFFLKQKPDRQTGDAVASEEVAAPRKRDLVMWVALTACGSVLLMSLTNQMCQDVAVVPFFWVVPLSLYLLTFIIAFDHERWYRRRIVIPLAAVAVGLVVILLKRQFADTEWHLGLQIVIYCAAIFFGCLISHGETVRLKPHPRFLTGFYLSISLGGAIGGIFVSLCAPNFFPGYWELHIGLIALAILTSIQLGRRFWMTRRSRPVLVGSVLWSTAVIVLTGSLISHLSTRRDGLVEAKRGFYGVLQVYEENVGTSDIYRALYHGRISHGRQYLDERYEMLATTYYSHDSGCGAVFEHYSNEDDSPREPLDVGVVGLGVGTLAGWAERGDRFRFYEINPQVEEIAREDFTYLEKCEGEEIVILGDGRISLENEESQQFDVLFVDAFSGDSIPLHLLTEEAFAVYEKHLKPDGILAIHITNLHLDLSGPVRTLAERIGLSASRVEDIPDDDEYHTYYSDWILLSREEGLAASLDEMNYLSDWEDDDPGDTLWTDDYSNLLEVVVW